MMSDPYLYARSAYRSAWTAAQVTILSKIPPNNSKLTCEPLARHGEFALATEALAVGQMSGRTSSSIMYRLRG